MCGRYALALRPSDIRRILSESNMPSQESADDEEVRTTYNFAPGYFGLVYREDVPDRGAGYSRNADPRTNQGISEDNGAPDGAVEMEEAAIQEDSEQNSGKETKYKLQSMKWGLIPFWTKRNPDYGTLMRTINCRDDSLASQGGMWQTMKLRKRCIVICQGFFEWLKKNGGKEKIPHFIKRKDGQLMCFAGLWDCVKYEDSDDKLYTYSIVTTDSNKQLSWLHDRMPVILENGSADLFKWLDSSRTEWTKELQSLLTPFTGELECYPVSKEVGKVGNDSPSFLIPLNSKENKQNIANFFGNQKNLSKTEDIKDEKPKSIVEDVKDDNNQIEKGNSGFQTGADDIKLRAEEPVPENKKRAAEDSLPKTPLKAQKTGNQTTPSTKIKSPPTSSSIKKRSTRNEKTTKSPIKASQGSQKITSFFNK